MTRNSEKATASAEAEAADWIARRDAGLTASEERAFETWMREDPRHRAALARFEGAWRAFDRPRITAQGDELLNELSARSRRRRVRRVGVGTALAVIAAAALIWRKPAPPMASHSSARLVSAPAIIHSPGREVLPDGSVVELDDGAQIVPEFSAAVRRVALVRGEALFHVTKNPSRPFVVAAAGVDVRAVGTAFSVKLGRSDVAVLVTEGKVSVGHETAAPGAPVSGPSGGSASTPGAPLAYVEAGQRLVVPVDAGAAFPRAASRVTSAEMTASLAWRGPRVEFSGTPLSEAVAIFNEHARGPGAPTLVVGEDPLASMRISGIFRVDNTDAFVHLLEAGFGVKAERSGDTIVLVKAP